MDVMEGVDYQVDCGWRKVVQMNKLQFDQQMNSDMEFVKNFTQPDFQAKNFTPQKRVNCDIFLANQQRKCIKY